MGRKSFSVWSLYCFLYCYENVASLVLFVYSQFLLIMVHLIWIIILKDEVMQVKDQFLGGGVGSQ